MTTLHKHCLHQGKLDELTPRFPAFYRLEPLQLDRSDTNLWHFASDSPERHQCDIKKMSGWLSEGLRRNAYIQSLYPQSTFDTTYFYSALVLFMGKTGYGKSSTVNALLGQPLLTTSDVEACTRECQSLDFRLHSNCYLSLADLPGIGESLIRDKEYLAMYQAFLAQSMTTVYVLRADSRDYAVDELAMQQLFNSKSDQQQLVIALNCCDKMEPVSREYRPTPSAEQLENIARKIETIEAMFNPVNPVIPYSAATGWNLDRLVDSFVKTVRQSKRGWHPHQQQESTPMNNQVRTLNTGRNL